MLWSENHIKTLLPSLAVMLVLGLVLRLLLIKKSEKIRMIPFQVCAVFIAVMEVFKQVNSFRNGYDLYHIPLHFCSLFIFALPLMGFYFGKYKNEVRAITATLCASLFVLMMICPNVIYSGDAIAGTFRTFSDFHTTSFHTVVTFAFVLIVALDLHKPNPKKEMRVIWPTIAIFCAVASVMAQVLQTNFHNFLRCNLPPIEEMHLAWCEAMGYAAGHLLYVLVMIVINLVGVWICYWFYTLLAHLMGKLPKRLQS